MTRGNSDPTKHICKKSVHEGFLSGGLDVESDQRRVGDAAMTDWLLSGLAMLTGEAQICQCPGFSTIILLHLVFKP